MEPFYRFSFISLIYYCIRSFFHSSIISLNLGYCQSMNNIVAILLLLVDEEHAFRIAGMKLCSPYEICIDLIFFFHFSHCVFFTYHLVILIHYIAPDYYSNNMIGLQTDQLVISKLIDRMS